MVLRMSEAKVGKIDPKLKKRIFILTSNNALNQTIIRQNYLKIECGREKKNNNLDSKTKSKKSESGPPDRSQTENKESKDKKDKEKDEQLAEIIEKIEQDKSVLKEITPEDVSSEIDQETIDDFLSQVASLFDQETVEALAKQSGFVKRRSPLTGHLFMTIFTFGVNIYGEPTLNQLVGLLDLVANVEMTRQALHDRITEYAVDFFEEMLSLSIDISLPDEISINVLDTFNRVMILDSTSFKLPEKLSPYFAGSGGSASAAGIKIQFAYDLKSSKFICLIQDGKTPDNRYDNSLVKYMKQGDLTIRDLGYSNIQVFIDLNQKGCYFVSRLKSDVKVYIKNDNSDLEEFYLDKHLLKMSHNFGELEIYLKKNKYSIPK